MKQILLFFLLFSNSAFCQINLTQGLIAHYPFTGNANDISGNNINGTVSNASLTNDKNGNPNSAYYFNGTNAYIQLPYSALYNFLPQDSFSISVWVLPDQGNPWPAQSLIVKSPVHPDYTLSLWNYGIYMLNYRAMSGFAYNNILNGSTVFINSPCWYNIITTYKNGVWNLYVDGNLEATDASQTNFILQDGASRISFGKKGESFGDFYKGKMDEVRIYNRVLNQDEVKAIVGTCKAPCTIKNDFSFSRNPCSPNTITFSTTSISYNSISWDFGDTNTATGSSTALHTYTNPGNYQVVMIQDYGTCIDTVKKTITVDIQNDSQTILTNDTTICFGKTKQLLSSPALSYCWTPTTFLNNPSAQNPVSSATQSITYYLTTESNGSNLITNGNFSAGNTGFSSQYFYTSNNTKDAEYFVGTSPQAWYFAHFPCTDHTTGNGNMMLVNGSEIADLEVWKTTVTVTPNTNYSFSTWISSISNPNPAQLAFSINGNSLGSLINATVPPCNWNQFYTTWNSGNATSATISIINKNTIFFGNDFALDDISFSPVYIKRDSIKITVDTPSINTNPDLAVCEGTQTQLATTGASTYTWSPANGLSNPNISNPIATPAITTKYFVTGTNNFGCISKDSITITVNPKPVITITNDTLLCNNATLQLSAGGGTSYTWSPAASLNNNLIPNPVASPSAKTKYYVTVKDVNNCSNTDSVQVDIRSANNFTVSPPVGICKNDSIQLTASGGDTYSWNNALTLDNASVSNPFALPLTTTAYSVLITDTACHNSTTLTTTVTVLPLPVLLLTKSNDIDCSSNQSQLTASGATIYSWLPSGTLNNPAVYNPIAAPAATTNYIVTGTDLDGCMNTDSITVLVNADNKGGYLMPNAFTPNNDGVNDCYGTKYWGIILEIEFSIYNRWGERIFYTADPAKCWDGTYKGIQQNPDVFSYTIKAKTSCESYVFRKGTFTLIR